MSKLPASHRTQTACATCASAFEKRDYDEGPDYFCTREAPLRPKCLSTLMDECPPSNAPDGEWGAAIDAWYAWSEPRRVKQYDICDNYTPPPQEPPREHKEDSNG